MNLHPPSPPARLVGRRRAAVRFRLAAAVVALLAFPGVAAAHGHLRHSTPAAEARLSVPPRELRLTFSEDVELAETTIRLVGPDDAVVSLSELVMPADSPRTVAGTVRGLLASGRYTVRWKTMGTDGHPTSGSFAFTIVAPAAGAGSSPPTAAPPAQGEPGGRVPAPGQAAPPGVHHPSAAADDEFAAGSPAYVAVRWLQFTALLVLIGAAAFRLLVLRALQPGPMVEAASRRAAGVGLSGAAALGLAAVLRLIAQSYAMHGAAAALDPGRLGMMLTRTLWGWGWWVQVIGVVLALAGFALARKGSRAGWTLACVGAVALAFTPALSGHASSAPRLVALAIIADAAHVIGAAGWLGTLLLVVAVGIPAAQRLSEAERGRAVAALVNAFSPAALAFAGLVALTGLFAAWLHVGSFGALWDTRYGKLLMLKLAVLAVVAGTGAYNWLRVKPALGGPDGAARLRRSATVELSVGLLVLLVTAVLVATPTAMDLSGG